MTSSSDQPPGARGPSRARQGGRAGLAVVRWLARAVAWVGRRLRGRVVRFVGGPARARVIVIFGGVLGLSSAQIATVGAVAPQLEHALRIGNTKIGLLNSVALLVGAVAVIPVGLLVDRFRRIPMLAASMVLWSVTTILGAVASSYSMLLLTRVGLGAVAATAGPAIASLTGDYFPSRERARVYGYILSGEIAGTAAGFIISGTLASVFSWRVAFFVLALPGFVLARSLWRTIPEPQRGGQSRLAPGTLDLVGAVAAPAPPTVLESEAEPVAVDQERDLAREAAIRRGFKPDPKLVLDRDPDSLSLTDAILYVLRIPTNMLLIVSSSLGYFFFAGLQTFALVFMRGHYHASQATATLVLGLLVLGALVGTLAAGPITDALTHRGRFEARVWVPAVCQLAAAALLVLVIASVIGTLISGRLTDGMVRRGFLEGRVWVPAVCYLGAVVLFVPGVLIGHLTPALWFDVGGAALLSAANPPLDAARLDIMPSGLWGRAESIRTFLRSLAQALAPLVFGGIADLVAGFVPHQAPIGTHAPSIVSSATGTGLQVSFLILLVTLAAAGIILLRARSTYPTDVATAGASWTPPAAEATGSAPPAPAPDSG